MFDHDRFWVSMQLGRSRKEAVQEIFKERLKWVFISTFFVYSCLIIYALVSLYFTPDFPSTPILTLISTSIGFLVAIYSIKFGFENHFLQELAKPKVITYFGTINYQEAKVVVTFLNVGETVLIRNVSLHVWSARKKKPYFGIVTIEPIFLGWKVLKEGECFAFTEEAVKRSIAKLESRLKDEKVGDLFISVMAGNEEFDLTDRRSYIQSLVGGCRLGSYSELIKYAKSETEDYQRVIPPPSVYFGFSGILGTEDFRMTTVIDIPPSLSNINLEILQKLDSIEKLLLEAVGKKRKVK